MFDQFQLIQSRDLLFLLLFLFFFDRNFFIQVLYFTVLPIFKTIFSLSNSMVLQLLIKGIILILYSFWPIIQILTSASWCCQVRVQSLEFFYKKTQGKNIHDIFNGYRGYEYRSINMIYDPLFATALFGYKQK